MNFAVGNTSGTRIDTRTNGWVCFNYDEWTFLPFWIGIVM